MKNKCKEAVSHLLLIMITVANPTESNPSLKRSTHPLQRNLLILIVRFCAIHLQDKNTQHHNVDPNEHQQLQLKLL